MRCAEVVETLPAVSTALAVTDAVPSGCVAEFQVTAYGGLVTVPTTTPSTRRSTWSTPEASDADAASCVGPAAVVSPPGDVSATVGDVWSVSATEKSSLVRKPTARSDGPTLIAV